MTNKFEDFIIDTKVYDENFGKGKVLYVFKNMIKVLFDKGTLVPYFKNTNHHIDYRSINEICILEKPFNVRQYLLDNGFIAQYIDIQEYLLLNDFIINLKKYPLSTKKQCDKILAAAQCLNEINRDK